MWKLICIRTYVPIMCTSTYLRTKQFLRFIIFSFRKNENLRKVHHILLVYAMFHPGMYVSMCVHCVRTYVHVIVVPLFWSVHGECTEGISVN